MRNCPIILLVMLHLTISAGAQPGRIRDFQALLLEKQKVKGFERDTAYIDLLDKIADSYWAINVDSEFWYAQKAEDLAEKISYISGEARSLKSIGTYYNTIADYGNMWSFTQKALSLAERIDDKFLVAAILMDRAGFYGEIGKNDEAIADLNRSYELSKQVGNPKLIAYALANLGDATYKSHGPDEALKYYWMGLEVARKLTSEYVAWFIRVDIGMALNDKGKYKEALGYFLPPLHYYRLTNDKLGIIHTQQCLATAYKGLGMPVKATRSALESLSLAMRGKNMVEIRDAAKILAELTESQHNYQQTVRYLKLYKKVGDSIFNDDTRKKTVELEAEYKYQKKVSLMQLEVTQDKLLQAAREKKLRLTMCMSLLVIFLLSALVIALYKSRSIKVRTNRALAEKNAEISYQHAQIGKQAELLLQNNRQKDQLFSIIAHDLRGPLMSLKAMLDFLKEKSLSEVEIARTVNSLNNNVNYTADLVNNLLYWARNQMNGIQVAASAIELEPLAVSIVNLFAGQAVEKKIQMENRLDKNITVRADKDMVLLVLRNVISNAIKFCRPGDKIIIEGEGVRDGLANFYIADTGVGIKPEVLMKINNSESVTTFGTSSEKGTGLGLLLCKEFIEKNGGRFSILSEWGKGSRVCFSLPVVNS